MNEERQERTTDTHDEYNDNKLSGNSEEEKKAAELNNDPNPLYGPGDDSFSSNENSLVNNQKSVDEKDEKIKNEADTARIRSERQSVIDGEKNREA